MSSKAYVVKDVVKIRKVIANSHISADCKSAAYRFDGSNPSSPTNPKKPRTATVLGLFLFVFTLFYLAQNCMKQHEKA